MQAEEMTAEQLMELARAKAGAETVPAASRVIDVDGLAVTVDGGKLKSWDALKLMRRIDEKRDNVDMDAIDAMFAFVAYVSDATEERIVEHCGGGTAPIEDVVGLLSRVMVECYPKN